MFFGLFVNKKVKNGPLVMGTLISRESTTMVPDQLPTYVFTIRFTTQTGQQITATVRDKMFVPDTEETTYQPGKVIPLHYDPKNPQKIMIDWNVANQK